jgi:hypothetical protein
VVERAGLSPAPEDEEITGVTWTCPPKYAMFTGAGSPATGGPVGAQQTGGGWSVGFVMLFAFGM